MFSCLGGGLLLGFQALSTVVGTKGAWKSLTLVDIAGEENFAWLGKSTLFGLAGIVESLVTMPLFILLFCIGGLFLILDYFFGHK